MTEMFTIKAQETLVMLHGMKLDKITLDINQAAGLSKEIVILSGGEMMQSSNIGMTKGLGERCNWSYN